MNPLVESQILEYLRDSKDAGADLEGRVIQTNLLIRDVTAEMRLDRQANDMRFQAIHARLDRLEAATEEAEAITGSHMITNLEKQLADKNSQLNKLVDTTDAKKHEATKLLLGFIISLVLMALGGVSASLWANLHR